MPSDERTTLALRALARPIAAYRAAVVAVTERARGHLAIGGGAERTRVELGQFAAGHIDPERFAKLFARGGDLDAMAERGVRHALDVLREIGDADDEIFLVSVPAGGRMSRVVASKLARLGRAFGAARVIELARAGAYRPAQHDAWLEEFPFDEWNRTERRLAPPIVVSVDGADLRVGALAEFADGAEKILIVVRGACAPAPLERLITPGTFVMQTADATQLARAAAVDGPAIAALVPSDAAAFVHDPASGDAPWKRLTVSTVPAKAPAHALGALSAWEQGEELKQLLALSQRPPEAAVVANGASAPDPAEQLAAWLLERANLGAAS